MFAASDANATRECPRCERTKPLVAFYVNRTRFHSLDGRDRVCGECRKVEVRSRRARRPESHPDEQPHAMTQAEVAAALGVTRGYVSQLEALAMKKIRARLRLLFARDLRQFTDHDIAAVLFRS